MIKLPFSCLYNKLNGLQQKEDVLVTEGRMKAFCTNNLYQNSWKAYQLILISQKSTGAPLNQARIVCSHTKGNTNSNCGNFLKLSGCVLQGVKPQKPKGLRSYTLAAFKMEIAKKKRIFLYTYLCVNVSA